VRHVAHAMPGSPSLTCDCAPCVAAPQVSRLHRQRTQFRGRGREALEQLAKVQGLLDNIDVDFSVVNQVGAV
jgi:hypothetical protein